MDYLYRVKVILLILLFLPIQLVAQEIVVDNYYFILEEDTIEGFYSDFEIENGKFVQYKVINCQHATYRMGLYATAPDNELTWRQVLRGEFNNFKPSGEWHQRLGPPDCDGNGAFSWKRTTYLKGDSIQLNYWNYQIIMTSDSSYLKGQSFEGYHSSKEWECMDYDCQIWLRSGSDTLNYSFVEIQMHLDTYWINSKKFQRIEN